MMTEQDIYKMASDAGFADSWFDKAEPDYPAKPREGTLTGFARLVAERIVRECIGITDDMVIRNTDGTWTSNEIYTDYNGALFQVKRKIQETFGFEE